jgi:hypothetical protein
LDDGDTTRERPLTIYGNSMQEIEAWATQVLPKALEGGAVNVYQMIEQHVKMIPKLTNEKKS